MKILIQARTNSSRLPGKVFLPLGKIPLVELVYRRVVRAGYEAIIVTSNEPSDDLLASRLEVSGIPFARGPLDDVLTRFVNALSEAQDSEIVVRLTADNPFPDDGFIDIVVKKFLESGAKYLAYGNDGQWLPYGLSVEVTRVEEIRRADRSTNSAYDREHVTSEIRRRYENFAIPFEPTGLARVKLDSKWGLIEKNGDWRVQPTYDEMYRVHPRFFKVKFGAGETEGFISQYGKLISFTQEEYMLAEIQGNQKRLEEELAAKEEEIRKLQEQAVQAEANATTTQQNNQLVGNYVCHTFSNRKNGWCGTVSQTIGDSIRIKTIRYFVRMVAFSEFVPISKEKEILV